MGDRPSPCEVRIKSRWLRRFAALMAVAAFAVVLHVQLSTREKPSIATNIVSQAGATRRTSEVPKRTFSRELEGLRTRSSAPWRVPEAEFRLLVEPELLPVQPKNTEFLPDGGFSPPMVAMCRLLSGTVPHVAARAFDASGRELACHFHTDGPFTEISLELAGAEWPLEIYYPATGNGDGQGRPAIGQMGLSLSVRELPPGRANALQRLPQVASAFKEAKTVAESLWPQVDDRSGPFGRYDNYIALYRGWLACPVDGIYTFGLDADDRAFLLVDGEEVLAGGAPGHLPPQPFAFRAARPLKAGLHALAFYHVQGTGSLRARLAWQMPGRMRMRPIPPSAFDAHIPARAVALEHRDRDVPEVFFSARPVRRFLVNRSVPVTDWELVASGPRPPEGVEGVAWSWREGERLLGEGARLRLSTSSMAGARRITVALEGPSGELGRYTTELQALRPDPLGDEELAFRLEIASAPVFLYPHEHFELHVRAINDSEEPVALELTESIETSDRREVVSLGIFELPAIGPPESDVLDRRMNRIRRRFGPGEATQISKIVYVLGPPGAPAVKAELVCLPSRSGALPAMFAKDGALWLGERPGAQAVRALLLLPYDTEDNLRRWTFLKYIAPFAAAFSRRAIFYGDPLVSSGASGGEGLESRLRAELGSKGFSLGATRFPEGEYPIHAACAGIDGALSGSPRPGRVWISLGLADVRAGTPIPEFERGIDFLIDRVWTLAPGTRLVLVGPPPEWGRMSSAQYAAAASSVAARHGVSLVDLHAILGRPELIDSAYRELGPDDGVRFIYPVGDAMDRIVREVLSW